MLKFAGTCSPEQLQTLQKVFDSIWMELRASTTCAYDGPSDPDELRDEIARRVLEVYSGEEKVNANLISKRVLKSFGIETDLLRAQSGSGAAAQLKSRCQ